MATTAKALRLVPHRDYIPQAVLHNLIEMEKTAKGIRKSIREDIDAGLKVEEGPHTIELATRRKAIPVKKYREWLVGATSEGQVSRREKLVKRGEYDALVIR